MKIKVFCNLTKPLFSLFSLPFLLAQAEMALFSQNSLNKSQLCSLNMLETLLIALGAFFCARSGGMIINAIIDASIDAKNPRTTQRAIPQKLISTKNAWAWVMGFFAIFLFLSSTLGTHCLILSFLSLLLIVSYPYTKYFSIFCHFFLGCIYMIAMLTTSVIIKNSISLADALFGLSAFFVIAANDIVYAIQDIDFDKKERLYSIPARWGRERSHTIARILLVTSYVSFILISLSLPLPYIFLPFTAFPLCSILCTTIMLKKSSEQNLYKTFILANIVTPLSFFASVTLFLFNR
ncbi:UbiA-like polyprenyltransferase [Chlamydiifrater phoenicopteri]|uniref:UbiA-like polyprenyltransferase n=1 Tax=Chlamydiifrater phoenicopteri TaxID=2681469 RepID=UPI001BCEBEE3|nr:UbiA-like polyprenyltransferase [Chlamydiifrater phoenicopteri]